MSPQLRVAWQRYVAQDHCPKVEFNSKRTSEVRKCKFEDGGGHAKFPTEMAK